MSRPDSPAVDWRAVAAATTDGVGIVDGERFVHADDRLAELYGYDDADDLVGSEWRAICEPSDRDRIDREAVSGSQSGSTWRGGVTGRRADGSTFRHELAVRGTEGDATVWAVREVSDEERERRTTPERAPGDSDDQYRRLFDAAPVPIGVFTADGEIVYCNEAAADFLGADGREHVVGRSPAAFVHPDDREQVGRRIEQVIEEREPTAPLEERLVGLDGEERIAVVSSAPATYDGDPAAQVVMNDITEYKRTQAELEEKRLFLQSVTDAVDDIVYVLDEDGEFYDWNEGAVETLGYTNEELADMHPVDVIPEDQHESVPGLMEAIDDIEDRRVDVDVLTKEGERLTHEFKGTTFEHPKTGEQFRCGVARDVTERRERQRELERYETIIETVDDGVYAFDEDLEFTFVNERLCEMFDTSKEELLGTPGHELFDDDEIAEAATIRERLIDSGAGGGTIQGTIQTPEGELILESRYRLHPRPDDGDFRGSVGVVRDVTEVRQLQREIEEEHRFLQNVIDALDDVLYVVDEEGRFVVWNDEATERFGYSDEEMAEIDPIDFVTPPGADALDLDPLHIMNLPDRHDIELVAKGGESISHELHGVNYTDEETGDSYRVGIARDVTDRLERERTLERQRDDLATLDRINELLLETAREVIETGSREAVEETVCERLAASDFYRFTWVGEREYDGDRIVPRVVAGDDGGYLDEVTINADGRDTGLGPVGRAMQTGEVQVADVTDPAFGPWREAATERGFESVAAVPLHHDDSVYGVVVIYATRDDAFSLREQAGFDVLGRAVGSVIYASRNRDLLFADAVVELEFAVARPEAPLLRYAGDLGCELALDGYVSSGDQWVLYVTVDGVPPTAVVEAVAEDTRIDHGRVVSEVDDGGRVELVADDLSLLDTVTAAGATVREATADPSGARVIVEAPVDAEVRDVVTHIQNEYLDWELVAHRERDREATTTGRPGGLLADLTDKQRDAIEAAYRARYFAWPRESTAEEVAESLDLAPPTLHGHLRKAEQAILTGLLDGR